MVGLVQEEWGEVARLEISTRTFVLNFRVDAQEIEAESDHGLRTGGMDK